jgi:hypothetical protein
MINYDRFQGWLVDLWRVEDPLMFVTFSLLVAFSILSAFAHSTHLKQGAEPS